MLHLTLTPELYIQISVNNTSCVISVGLKKKKKIYEFMSVFILEDLMHFTNDLYRNIVLTCKCT